MCGPVAALLSRRASVSRSWFSLALLHLGRLSAYSLVGLAAGGIGQAAGLGIPFLHQIQGVLSLLAANLAVYFALSILGWLPSPEKLLSGWVKGWGRVMRSAGVSALRLPGWAAGAAPFGLGAVWGLLPCGMVLAALFTSLTSASATGGALQMLAFGLGTLPALLTVRWLAGLAWRPTWPRFTSALIMLLFGLQFALRGLSTWGIVGHLMLGQVMVW
jgi:sulfite exporter TauE/SafE